MTQPSEQNTFFSPLWFFLKECNENGICDGVMTFEVEVVVTLTGSLSVMMTITTLIAVTDGYTDCTEGDSRGVIPEHFILNSTCAYVFTSPAGDVSVSFLVLEAIPLVCYFFFR